jgi:hypothetical protein
MVSGILSRGFRQRVTADHPAKKNITFYYSAAYTTLDNIQSARSQRFLRQMRLRRSASYGVRLNALTVVAESGRFLRQAERHRTPVQLHTHRGSSMRRGMLI